MDITATEVLLPKKKIISVCGIATTMKPLTLRQLLSALTILKAARADLSIPDGDNDQATMVKWFAASGDALPELASVVTGIEVGDLVDISLEDVSEISLAICEVNNFEKIFSNFQKAMELVKPKKSMLSPSPSGS